jgi:hypothetical protein
VAKWIAARQGIEGAYAGMFAPTPHDFNTGARLFTGEGIASRIGTAHVLGEEACRALLLLGSRRAAVRSALRRATEGIGARLAGAESRGGSAGFFCCGTCACAVWRHLTAGGLSGGEKRLSDGLRALRRHRDGAGRWRRFPFYYTLLALSEIDLPAATRELRYAAPACERAVRTRARDGQIARRRRLLLERVLERV